MSQNNSNHLSLAKFAFNIYGTLNQSEGASATSSLPSTPNKLSASAVNKTKLIFNCEREVSCLSELNYPLNNIVGSYYDTIPSHHVLVGGKNYLKLLALNTDQSAIINEINLLDQYNPVYNSNSRLQSNKLNNVNTIKSQKDLVACGLSNGTISIYKVNNNGKSRLIHKFSDHKRCINSLDFIDSTSNFDGPNQLLSGSQDGTIKLWDLRSSVNKPVMTVASSSHSDPIRSCQYSPHNTVRNKLTVLSVHDSGSLCIYDLRTQTGGNNPNNNSYSQHSHQNQMSLPERKLNFHSGPALSLHIHPEKEYVITGGRDKKLCVWNYGEASNHLSKVSPDCIVHTYGPVMKVRWSEHADSRPVYSSDGYNYSKDSIFNYDFACLYLNEDTTITVYNLKRKFIPKEIITTTSRKPFQNFIWARNRNGLRKLWTITKSNLFASYELDYITDESSPNILRPLDHLSQVSVDWNSAVGGLCFVDQRKNEFQSTVVTPDHEGRKDSYYSETFNENIASNTQFNSNGTSINSSPMEKPPFIRTSTYNPLLQAKSPSPIPQQRANNTMDVFGFGPGIGSSSSLQRPPLKRNASQSTQGSAASQGSSPIQQAHFTHHNQQANSHGQTQSRRVINVYHPSPYLVPLSLPLPLNDDEVFKCLADSYLMEVPESFNLVDVCFINARIAAAVNRFRDCQIWRILAVSLEQDSSHYDHIDNRDTHLSNGNHLESENSHDDKSILSDIGNIVGSYNSNSTLTTNYGGVNGTGGETTGGNSVESSGGSGPLSNTKDRNLHAFTDHKNSSSHSFIDSGDQSMSQGSGEVDSRNKKLKNDDESAIDDDDYNDNDQQTKEKGTTDDLFKRSVPIKENSVNTGRINSASSSPIKVKSSSSFNNPKSFTPKDVFLGKNELNEVDERQEDQKSFETTDKRSVTARSELTRAFHERSEPSPNEYNQSFDLSIPWSTTNLLEKSLDYAMHQGDIIMSATLILLFYDYSNEDLGGVIKKHASLECIALYVEILRRKQLFTNAVKVVKVAPKGLLSELNYLTNNEINLRFYCNWCLKLLVNEKSKEYLSRKQSDEFGYWYCDECSKKQYNCVYCNEPCKGLNVVVSLRCGHRGHFGCLREWFVEGENVECPGGCDELIFV
ncbi:hypothetical protein HYPBUDRAFT_125806 [Hyphopichia burtonii NRRL Y-1933]|uniref:Restriction of telomere capping protein 1 n=1 Tax=Hyphopichia burtonii NRRL Y-1933 TaxID=984485 RepID=A0A1E4RGL7_9ASCO|nr:hypothetical protein HYPBUDRAFT_125806 [Hyphopichia burtonii NRRL Y-1933]ODV66398.1 hypothetical protein HYPBUDRAFT_125806 [Hyphopichia burtonii NRRL Y-1933]